MMVRITCVMAMAMMLWSCSSEKQYPGKRLPPAKMEKVMWDMLEAEAFVRESIKSDSSVLHDTLLRWQAAIFKKHAITPDDYYGSLDFYIDHGGALIPILDSMTRNKQQKKITTDRKRGLLQKERP